MPNFLEGLRWGSECDRAFQVDFASLSGAAIARFDNLLAIVRSESSPPDEWMREWLPR